MINSSVIRTLYLLIIYFLFTPYVLSHDGTDELRDFGKNKQKVVVLQKNVKDKDNKNQTIENLNSQINLLQRNILILRNKLIEDSPKIKSNMSKHNIDYMGEVDFILKKVNRVLKDSKNLLSD